MSYTVLNISSSKAAVDVEGIRVPYGESTSIEQISASVIQLVKDGLVSIDLTGISQRIDAIKAKAVYWRDFTDGNTDMTGWDNSDSGPLPIPTADGLPLKDYRGSPEDELYYYLSDNLSSTAGTLVTKIKIEPEGDLPTHVGGTWAASWRAIGAYAFDEQNQGYTIAYLGGTARPATGAQDKFLRVGYGSFGDMFGETGLGTNAILANQSWDECVASQGGPFGNKAFCEGLLITRNKSSDSGHLDINSTAGNVHSKVSNPNPSLIRTNRYLSIFADDFTYGTGPTTYVSTNTKVGYVKFLAYFDEELTNEEVLILKEYFYG